MKILVVCQYFPPEAGATQNRMDSFVGGLEALGHEVTVICEQPCHPSGIFAPGYGRRPVQTEDAGGRTVHRLWVAASPVKSTPRRLAFYGTFAAGAALACAGVGRPDVVFASSPPLPGVLAVTAVVAARRLPLVVDVRDIWPAAAEALGELSNRRILAAFERAERWMYRRSTSVTATTRPFCRHIDEVAGRRVSVHLPNGALDELVALPDAPRPASDEFVVGYAGNLGIAQGLGIVLDAADRLRDDPVRFVMLGDGPLSAQLRAQAATRGLDRVEFRPGVPVEGIGTFLRSCDALLVPLRDHPAFTDFIPSKLYDAMAVGRPAIVAARGEAPALLDQSGAGLVVAPEDGDALAQAVRRLMGDVEARHAMGAAGRRAAAQLARSRQVARLEEVLAAAAGPQASR